MAGYVDCRVVDDEARIAAVKIDLAPADELQALHERRRVRLRVRELEVPLERAERALRGDTAGACFLRWEDDLSAEREGSVEDGPRDGSEDG